MRTSPQSPRMSSSLTSGLLLLFYVVVGLGLLLCINSLAVTVVVRQFLSHEQYLSAQVWFVLLALLATIGEVVLYERLRAAVPSIDGTDGETDRPWFPEIISPLTASPQSIPMAPTQTLYWDEPGTGRYVLALLPEQFDGPEARVSLSVYSRSGTLDRSLDGQRLFFGKADEEIAAGCATFRARDLDAGGEIPDLRVGPMQRVWPLRPDRRTGRSG